MDAISLEQVKVGDIKGNFVVPEYQRGYRWGEEEVEQLLEDIAAVAKGDNYCLQPIVVKKTPEHKYELIDGQQRLTTLYLLINYIISLDLPYRINFSLEYKTKDRLTDFLMSICNDVLKQEPETIDEDHVINAYKKIASWFECIDDTNDRAAAENLHLKLQKNIYVIWYEVDTEEDSVLLFTRFNIGRIPLTNAELVRALFLSRNNGINSDKQNEIALQWDYIERELHNDGFWYFLTNKNPSKYQTRIELIFDLMAGNKEHHKRFFTFFHFIDEIKNREDKFDVWKDVYRNYQYLHGWYEDGELYHKIGYLVASESVNLYDLINRAKSVTKSEFIDSLNDTIAKSIEFKKDYGDLSYENAADKKALEKLLLLFNVETIRMKDDKSIRFPFDRHKGKQWSLEHIHSRNSEGLNKNEHRKKWLEMHTAVIENIDKHRHKDLLSDMSDMLIALENKESLGEGRFDELFDRAMDVLTENKDDDGDYLHSLSNMALLGMDDNSRLSNSAFAVKRDIILDRDKKSDYIPECTRRVFLKYYTDSEASQPFFWNRQDRVGYLKEMNNVLQGYLHIIHREIRSEE